MIKIGDTRIVVVLPLLGVVIKIARIRIIKVIKRHHRILFGSLADEYRPCKKRFEILLKHWKYPSEYRGFPRWCLFSGIMCNRRECQLSRELLDLKLIAPTYFSLGGLINIQACTEKMPEDKERHSRIWRRLLHEVSEKDFFKDTHHWATETDNNCGLWNGQMVMYDYGGFFTGDLIRQYDKQIKKIFLEEC